MGKKLIIFFIIFVLIITSSLGAVLYSGLKTKNIEKPKIAKPDLNNISAESLAIKSEYLNYILNELGAYQLHNPPLLGDKPRIKFEIDNDIFTSEIENGKIETKKGSYGHEDLRFITTKEEI